MRKRLGRVSLVFLGVTAATALLATIVGFTIATAADPSGAPAAGESSAPKADGGPGRPGKMPGNTVLADFTSVDDAGAVHHLRIARGEVSALSADSITLSLASGDSATFALDADTKFRDAGKDATAADFKVGDQAMVAGEKTGDGYTADLVRRALTPDEIKALRQQAKDRLKDLKPGDHPRFERFLKNHPGFSQRLFGGDRPVGPGGPMASPGATATP